MDQNQNKEKEQVLLARNSETGQIGAVKGLNPDGTPDLAEVKTATLGDLVKFSKGQNPLEAFMSNFMRQCKNPSVFGFFKVDADKLDTEGRVMADLLQDPRGNEEMLKGYKVENSGAKQSQTKGSYSAIDESKINWENFKINWGVDRAELEKSGDLSKMLNYGKSALVKISPTLGGVKIDAEARLSLRTDKDGNVSLVPHFIHQKPNLERVFKGYKFSNADKEALLNTGNLGKVVELTGKNGEKIPSFVSIDRLTNEVVSMSARSLYIRDRIGQTQLTPEEIATLKEGKPIANKEITLSNGKTFKTTLQVNADHRAVEFVPKAWQNHSEKQINAPKNNWTDAEGNIRPISKWKENIFSDQQKADYVTGKTVELVNAVDSKGQPCTLYVKFDPQKQRPIASTTNPDLKVAPANESKVQVAVNDQGKTNEATKNVAEPLQKYQTAPKDDVQQRQQKKPKQKL